MSHTVMNRILLLNYKQITWIQSAANQALNKVNPLLWPCYGPVMALLCQFYTGIR